MSILNKLLNSFEQLLLYPDVSTDEELTRYEELVSVTERNPRRNPVDVEYNVDDWITHQLYQEGGDDDD